jgi:hypothetical protein
MMFTKLKKTLKKFPSQRIKTVRGHPSKSTKAHDKT